MQIKKIKKTITALNLTGNHKLSHKQTVEKTKACTNKP